MLAEEGKNNVFQDTCSPGRLKAGRVRADSCEDDGSRGFTREVILLNVVHVDAPYSELWSGTFDFKKMKKLTWTRQGSTSRT